MIVLGSRPPHPAVVFVVVALSMGAGALIGAGLISLLSAAIVELLS